MPVPLSALAMKLFVKKEPGELTVPGLIWEAAPSDANPDARSDTTTAGQQVERPRAGEPLIFMVEKGTSTNNPFAMGVTIGRVDSNDVVVDDASVSRFHAWLQQDDRTLEWALTDAESKNGTWIDAVAATPRQRMPLKDGSVIRVGDVQLTFFLPESLKAFVKARFDKS